MYVKVVAVKTLVVDYLPRVVDRLQPYFFFLFFWKEEKRGFCGLVHRGMTLVLFFFAYLLRMIGYKEGLCRYLE